MIGLNGHKMSGISPYKIRLPVGYGTLLTQHSLQPVRISALFSLFIRFIDVLLILRLLKQVAQINALRDVTHTV